ncbi:hypothetical protein NBRC116596_07070 [Litorivita sp. NS0012-18]
MSGTYARIRQRIQEKTTLHAYSNDGAAFQTDYLDFLGLSVFADFSGQMLDESVLAQSQLKPSSERSFELGFVEDTVEKQQIGIWVMGDAPGAIADSQRNGVRNSDRQRRVRLHLLRFSSELRALEVALSAATSGLLEFGDGQSSIEVFEGMIRTSLDRLVETSNETAQDLGELEIGQLANAEALFDIVNKIDDDLKQLDFARSAQFSERLGDLKARVGNLVVINNPRQNLDLSLENIGGDKVAGDQIKGNKGGVIGHTVKAKKMVVNTSWAEFDPNGDVDQSKLKAELSILKEAMLGEASTEGELEELSSIQKADLAAQKGEGSKVLEHLASAGKWTLGIAEKIGVPVAISVLKKMAGM